MLYLFLSDEQTLAYELKKILSRRGAIINHVSNWEGFTKGIEEEEPTIILMDVKYRSSFLKFIKAIPSYDYHIPVVFISEDEGLTGDTNFPPQQRVLELSMDDSPDVLATQIEAGAKLLLQQMPLYNHVIRLEKLRLGNKQRDRLTGYYAEKWSLGYDSVNERLTQFCRDNNIKLVDLAKAHDEFMEHKALLTQEYDKKLKDSTPSIVRSLELNAGKETR